MKIEGLPLDSGGIKNITEKKAPKPAPAEAAKNSDTVEISSGMGRKERVELSTTLPSEFPVRKDVLEMVARRISSRAYETPEVQEKVAERLIESPALSGAVYEAAGAKSAPVRTETVEAAETRAASGYHDRPEVMKTVAEHLVEALGLDGFIGK